MPTPLYRQKDSPHLQDPPPTGPPKNTYRFLIFLPLYLILPTAGFGVLCFLGTFGELSAYAHPLFFFSALFVEIIFTASFFCSILISFKQKSAAGFYINTAFWGLFFAGTLTTVTGTAFLGGPVLLFFLYPLLSGKSLLWDFALCCFMLLSGSFLFYRAVKSGSAEKSWLTPLLYLPVPVSILYSFNALLSHMEPPAPEAAEAPLSFPINICILEIVYVLLWLGTLYAAYRLCNSKAVLIYLVYWVTPILLVFLAAPLSLLFPAPFSADGISAVLILMTSVLLPLCVLTYPFFTLLLTFPLIYFLLLPLMALPGILACRQLWKTHPEQFTGRLAGLFSIFSKSDKTRTRP